MADPNRLDYETPDIATPFHDLKSPPSALKRGFGCLTFFACGGTAFMLSLILLVNWLEMTRDMIELLAGGAFLLTGIAVVQAVRFSRMG